MKKILVLLSFLMIFSCDFIEKKFSHHQIAETQKPVPTLETQGFVEGSKDIPLVVGLKKLSDDSLGFDSAGGSIAAITYKSKNYSQKVYDFYANTLPQMGWQKSDSKNHPELLRFKRDNEKLEIEILNQNGVDLVKFFMETVSD